MNGQTTLIESGPRACAECQGEKILVVPVASCHHSGNCPCGSEEVACPRCEGSGVEPCGSCGEPSVDRYLGEDLCAECLPSEEHRATACMICDRPIDVRERRVPLCSSCEATARVAGQQAADAQRYPDPEDRRVA